MARAIQFRRLFALAFLLAAGLAALGYRLVDLQVFQHENLRAQAQRNTHRYSTTEPMRGQIRDIRGNPLAFSVPAKNVCADPTLLGQHQIQIARALAPLLQMDEAALADRLQPRLRAVEGRVITNQYVVLKRKVPLDVWEQVQKTMAGLPLVSDESALSRSQRNFLSNLRRKSVFAEETQMRVYPNQALAAHVLGYVGSDEEMNGLNGIELALNSKLRGVSGWRRTETDVRRREVVAFRDQDVQPRDGMNVVLTIDAGLQHIVETQLAEAMTEHTPISITSVAVRPATGEILAMATLPNYDPGRPGASPMDALRNRAITDSAEPGSTFKIVVVSAGLNEQVITLTDQFDCEHGRFYYNRRTLRDYGSHGVLTVEGIIQKSSNIGSAKIGLLLGPKRLEEYVRSFGFGTTTGIPLPGEVRGIVHPVRNWDGLTIVQIPMGHAVTATPLQMTMAMSAIANYGKLMRPTLVKRLEDDKGQVIAEYQPQMVRQVVNETAARGMVQALKRAVGPEGTGTKAQLESFTVAGKSGTAQKPGPGGYMPGKYVSSFIGFFPADAPEICISIIMDEPKNGHFGGQVAAPVFRAIADRAARYLNVRPDILPEAERQALAAALGN